VLVLGSGAREHALARALVRGAPEREVVVAPGNGGVSGRLVRAAGDLSDAAAVVALARSRRSDLVVVGPEAPLCAGVVDALAAEGIAAFGPTASAARLEGSKAFLKELAREARIPTASFDIVETFEQAERVISERGAPIVVKADGLCAGKGVVVADSRQEALDAARSMLVDRVFGDAGVKVVIEERLSGKEVSVHAITDGERYLLLPPARDHKRIFDGDRGPNTGGMGVIAPAPDVGAELLSRIAREIVEPTLGAMRGRAAPFRGVLFAGIMVTPAGDPMLLEHNVRFGDPECEALMELVTGDVAGLFASAARGRLEPDRVVVAQGTHAAVVVLAAAGYPGPVRRGDVIAGIAAAEAMEGATVHHAGTEEQSGAIVTAGGRVLAVTARASSLDEARRRAYRAADAITFQGKQCRRDIGGAPI
jgi:phosphoribosylamine--glycine ligase